MNPQDMTPMEMREFMRQANSVSNELTFRNANDEVIFAVIYVATREHCAEVLDAVHSVTEKWDTENNERNIGE